MKYDGIIVGPVIRQLRKERNLSVYDVSEKTGLSHSSINQIEQGGRGLSMKSLYLFMSVFNCDANTILAISDKEIAKKKANSIDEQLDKLPKEQKEYFMNSFIYMLNQADRLVLSKEV